MTAAGRPPPPHSIPRRRMSSPNPRGRQNPAAPPRRHPGATIRPSGVHRCMLRSGSDRDSDRGVAPVSLLTASRKPLGDSNPARTIASAAGAPAGVDRGPDPPPAAGTWQGHPAVSTEMPAGRRRVDPERAGPPRGRVWPGPPRQVPSAAAATPAPLQAGPAQFARPVPVPNRLVGRGKELQVLRPCRLRHAHGRQKMPVVSPPPRTSRQRRGPSGGRRSASCEPAAGMACSSPGIYPADPRARRNSGREFKSRAALFRRGGPIARRARQPLPPPRRRMQSMLTSFHSPRSFSPRLRLGLFERVSQAVREPAVGVDVAVPHHRQVQVVRLVEIDVRQQPLVPVASPSGRA